MYYSGRNLQGLQTGETMTTPRRARLERIQKAQEGVRLFIFVSPAIQQMKNEAYKYLSCLTRLARQAPVGRKGR